MWELKQRKLNWANRALQWSSKGNTLCLELHAYFLIPLSSSKNPKGAIKGNFMKRKRSMDIWPSVALFLEGKKMISFSKQSYIPWSDFVFRQCQQGEPCPHPSQGAQLRQLGYDFLIILPPGQNSSLEILGSIKSNLISKIEQSIKTLNFSLFNKAISLLILGLDDDDDNRHQFYWVHTLCLAVLHRHDVP